MSKKTNKKDAKFYFLRDYCCLRDALSNLLSAIKARDYEWMSDAIENAETCIENAECNKITEMFEREKLEFEFDDFELFG
jgi:uncharacterized ferredoxin-like protein